MVLIIIIVIVELAVSLIVVNNIVNVSEKMC